ncbi:TauD/TfdA family dioxygenase [Moorena producens]|uniref:TauD/TfdA family dioxygenase n=1 Tax=Moorena producens TaxID=1155739 RepID=UPI003C741140
MNINKSSNFATPEKVSFVVVGGKRFHYIWLRDNCLCPECRHSWSFQRLYDISEYSSPPEPLSVEQSEEKLTITWKENPPHQSVYPTSWLMDHAYDPEPKSIFEPDILWDKAWLEGEAPKFYDIHACDRQLWMNQVSTLGFAVLRNIKPEELDPLVSEIGPVHEFEWGRFDAIISKPMGSDLAYVGNKVLLPHTDGTHRYDPRLVGFLYCVVNKTNGGDSIIIDGFRVAEDFRQKYPEYFQILVENQVQFRHYEVDTGYFFCRIGSVIEVDDKGNIAGLYVGPKNCYRYLPFDKVESYYEAYTTFFRYVKNPDYQYRFRLQAGDCLVYKNFRILHTRTLFDPSSGPRHLKVGYVGWHYFVGRTNFNRYKHLYVF